ncbi:MAG TPA: LarC family nickel insertion protein, partial [Polyangia bacterium]|nr:LarC family nickel insertion protein [Polyangia bacterium]
FHEVGAVDSIVDIVGIAAALDHLGVELGCAPLPLGRGFVETRHGTLPLPAPATLFLLEGVPVYGTEIESELVTPTGAAVVKACARWFGTLPPMVVERVGYGAGSGSHPRRPGLLRAVLGRAGDGGCCRIGEGSHLVIEANIDDITGQLAGEALDRLLEHGALDAWIAPIQMKKGRPAVTLSALCRRDDLERISGVFLRETPTIGLRFHPVGRIEMEREIREVETPFGRIRIKLARGPGGARNAAPEFEDCRRAAREGDVPLKRVLAAAAAAALDLAGGD